MLYTDRISVQQGILILLFLVFELMCTITIVIQDIDGTPIYNFVAKDGVSFLDMMEEQMMDYPYSCRAGACFSCVAKIVQWDELIDFGKLGMPLIDLDADQILTCVAGVKSEVLNWNQDQTIVLQKV
jgi:ferredoxin